MGGVMNFDEKLEEILNDFGNEAVNGVNKYNLNFATRGKIRTLVQEIIGEDEDIEQNATYVLPRKKLRAEQRNKLKEVK